MLLRVRHETYYDYEPEVLSSAHALCLHLRATPCQQVLAQELMILPQPDGQIQEWDAWGNCHVQFQINQPHSHFAVCSHALLRTRAYAPNPTAGLMRAGLSCAEVAQRVAANPALQVWAEPTALTQSDDRIAAWAQGCLQAHEDALWACVRLMQQLRADFVYLPQSTTVQTHAQQVFAQGSGVCQDFAHLMLAALRSVGLAARYVSGYLLSAPPVPEGDSVLLGGDASHAWVSVFIPNAQGCSEGLWCDFCPTNGRMGWHSPGEDFVTLAWGRDYQDVAPVGGVLTGAQTQRLRVVVQVQTLADDGAAVAVDEEGS